MRRYLWYQRRRSWLKTGIILGSCAAFTLILFLWVMFNKAVLPTVKTIAAVKAKSACTRVIHSTVNEVFSSQVSYDDLVKVNKDQRNAIQSIQSNVILMNRISSEIAQRIQSKLSEVTRDNINVPLSSVFRWYVFPLKDIEMQCGVRQVGNVEVNFRSEFSEAGINQTKHRICVDVKTYIQIYRPMMDEAQVIETSVPVAETVIVGSVPDTYVNINR